MSERKLILVSEADVVRGWHDRLVEARGKLTEVAPAIEVGAFGQQVETFLAATVEIDEIAEELFDRWQDLLREESRGPERFFWSEMTTPRQNEFVAELLGHLWMLKAVVRSVQVVYGMLGVTVERKGGSEATRLVKVIEPSSDGRRPIGRCLDRDLVILSAEQLAQVLATTSDPRPAEKKTPAP